MNAGRKIKSILLAFGVALGLMVLGTPAAYADQTGAIPITQIMGEGTSMQNGLIFIYSSAAWPNPAGCSNASRVAIDPSEGNYNLLVTMLYDAYVNGDLVNFAIFSTSCVNSGADGTYPRIAWFMLTKQ